MNALRVHSPRARQRAIRPKQNEQWEARYVPQQKRIMPAPTVAEPRTPQKLTTVGKKGTMAAKPTLPQALNRSTVESLMPYSSSLSDSVVEYVKYTTDWQCASKDTSARSQYRRGYSFVCCGSCGQPGRGGGRVPIESNTMKPTHVSCGAHPKPRSSPDFDGLVAQI